MKWLSATAIFAVALPPLTAFGEPETVDLNKNYKGTGVSTTDSTNTDFTQKKTSEKEIIYTVQGDVIFSTFTNIPEPTSDTEDISTDSAVETTKTETAPVSASETVASSMIQTSQTNSSTHFALPLCSSNFLYQPLISSNTTTVTTTPTTTTETATPTTTSTTTPTEKKTPPEPKGGGAFSNEQENAPLTFITNVGNPGSLTFDSIKMTGQGAVIYSKSPITIDGLKSIAFTNNLSQQSGGAISTTSLTISNIIESINFTSNSASIPAPIIITTPSGDTTTTSASSGEATASARIVASASTSPSTSPETPATETTTKIPSSYTQDTAGNGGAIYSSGTINFSKYKDLLFKKNTTAISEKATIDTGVIGGSGGAIFSGEALSITEGSGETFFHLNSAHDAGGAIYALKTVNLDNLYSLKFQSNKAKKEGGAIYATEALSISNNTLLTSFAANTATKDGGAIYAKDSVTFTNLVEARFTKNKAGDYTEPVTKTPSENNNNSENNNAETTTSPPTAKGGAIYAEKNVSISGVTSIFELAENTSTDCGGGLYTQGTLTCTDSHRLQFIKNSAGKDGGGLYCKDTVTLKNLTGKTLFQENTSKEKGGGLCLADSKSLIMDTLENFSLESNVAEKSGGGAYVPNECTLTFTSPDPKAKLQPVYGTVTIAQNSAKEDGGGIYSKLVAFSNLATVTINSNNATKKGGGLYTQEVTDKTDSSFNYITNISITNNSAGEDGGGIYGQKSSFERLDQLVVQNNTASKSGGALYLANKLTMTKIVSGTFSGNTAKEKGGAVYAKDVELKDLPGELLFTENKIEGKISSTTSITEMLGGGIYSETCKLSNISGKFFCTNNQVKNTSADTDTTDKEADLQGGGIYAKTTFTLENCSGEILFSGNSVKAMKTSNTKQIAGGAIYSPTVSITGCEQPLNFLSNSATSHKTTPNGSKDSFGGAIGAITSVTISKNPLVTFFDNYAEMGGAIGCYNTTDANGNGTVTLQNNGLVFFNSNNALKRGGAIYARTLNIPNGNVTFQNNSSKYDGSAICCTKSATITAGSTILFLNNKVTTAATTATNGATAVDNLGAAIYGDNSTEDVKISLIAQSGNILFKDNQCIANGKTKYCSIAGNVELDLKAAKDNYISFYDAVNITTKNGSAKTLDINKADGDKTYGGTILFSGEHHEHKSFIPQKITLHNGTLVLGKNAELSAVSFTQQEGTTVVLGPGSVLATHAKESGSISLNNIIIDFSKVIPTADNPASPPTLKVVSRSADPRDKITLTGNLYLEDPNNNIYNNPYLSEDREITLFNLSLVSGSSVSIQKLEIDGHMGAKKGYMGTWSLLPTSATTSTKLALKWTFDKYLRWEYIAREQHFYTNSIWGAQQSLIAVKQGLINNMMSNARFDDTAFNNIWVSGIGTFLNKKQGDTPAFAYHGRGYTVAIDAKPRPDCILGASFSQVFGHSQSENNLQNYRHKGSGHSLQASLYTGQAFYIPFRNSFKRPLLFQGVATYGYMHHDTTTFYPSIDEKNIANWENRAWLYNMRLSLDLKEPSQSSTSRFSIYGEAEYSEVRQDKFTELDYDPRCFDSCAYRNLTIPLGVSVEGAVSTYKIIIYNKLSAAFLPVLYRNKPVSGYEILSTGEKGVLRGVIPTRHAINAEYSQQIYLGSYWTLYGTYTVTASQDMLTQTANGGLRFIF
ncbi:polymorphic outer membrane protein middle domain-containing protein [Chlamydia sp. 17-3921]|uniref:polymorphic outer membrane protein middle domain-containing protein n=1 Tax=Chlamydia sp. 17-3921 TaxID=2675798 RepID=UPI001918F9FF|nr:polymorphic outer membrane protein middle domain-containing protein [Chlamydia sp. 17-3921]